MGTLILGVIVLIISTILIGNSYWADTIAEWIAAALMGTLISVLVVIIVFIGNFFFETENANPKKTDISAIKDNFSASGSFALGYGSINEEQYYYFIVSDDQGFKSIDKAEVELSKLKEGNVSQPYLITYEQRFTSSFARFMYGEFSGEFAYEFYVPENTITTNYNVDLE